MSIDSCTVDVDDWLGADVCTIGDVGGGVLGSEIPSTGANGPAPMWYALQPGDEAKEFCGRITTWPTLPEGATFEADENGAVRLLNAPDGVYSYAYQLLVDYAPVGTPKTVEIAVGEPVAAQLDGTATATSSASGTLTTVINIAGTATATSGALGTLTTGIALSGTATAASSASGFLLTGDVVTQTGRTFTVAAIDRSYVVAATDRAYTVAATDRRYTVAPADRTFTV